MTYIPPADTNMTVAKCFHDRFINRLTVVSESQPFTPSYPPGVGKGYNRLNALPGVPGCGKSAFLAHFPYSTAYNDYWKQRQNVSVLPVSTEKPLISILSFNTGMDYNPGEQSLGLRIIYGALKSTSIQFAVSWQLFHEEYKSLRDLRAIKAVNLLRMVFGNTRLFFIGVDEISKTMDTAIAEDIISQLGVVLNLEIHTDVLVSSLHPAYIKDLVTGSNRAVNYLPIVPLKNEKLGKQLRPESEKFVNKVNDINGSGKKLNKFVKSLLRNMYILGSGHPRTLEHLMKGIVNGELLTWIEPRVIRKVSVYNFLKELMNLPAFNYLLLRL